MIEPALTPEEWADPDHRVERDGFWVYEPKGVIGPVVGSEQSGVSIETIRHATAALCLNGQPFGFTRADVDLLEDMVRDHGEAFHDLADRIEALLPRLSSRYSSENSGG